MKKILEKIPVLGNESRFNIIWNIILLFSILSATIIFSYRLVFNLEQVDLFYWIIFIIYSFDILINMNTAFYHKFEVVDKRKDIIKSYLHGWFTIDLLAAFPFSFILNFIIKDPFANIFVTIVFVFFQLMRLLKLMKVKDIFNDLQENFNYNPNMRRLLSLAFWFMVGVNFIALGWCLIGATEQNRSHFDQYLRAVYWGITTIATIGYGDYGPNHEKNIEIIYTVMVEISGVALFGYMIGNISTLVANLDMAKANFIKKMEEINLFLRTKNVPLHIQQKVRNYYYYLWDTRQSVSSTNLLEEMPHTLNVEIALYLNRNIIEKVSLFKNTNEIFIREVVQLLEPMVFLPNDYIIMQGEFGDCMYFLSSGEVEVIVGDIKVAQLSSGSPFGETALIQGEKRMASIRAVSYCDVYRLTKHDFDVLREKYSEFDEQVKEVVRQRLEDTKKKTAKEE